jgi:hypothetical protein
MFTVEITFATDYSMAPKETRLLVFLVALDWIKNKDIRRYKTWFDDCPSLIVKRQLIHSLVF